MINLARARKLYFINTNFSKVVSHGQLAVFLKFDLGDLTKSLHFLQLVYLLEYCQVYHVSRNFSGRINGLMRILIQDIVLDAIYVIMSKCPSFL